MEDFPIAISPLEGKFYNIKRKVASYRKSATPTGDFRVRRQLPTFLNLPKYPDAFNRISFPLSTGSADSDAA